MASDHTHPAPGAAPSASGPSGGCRISEFARWNRIMLEHEREHISRAMAGRAFKTPEQVDDLMHDLSDLDYLIAQHDVRVEVPK